MSIRIRDRNLFIGVDNPLPFGARGLSLDLPPGKVVFANMGVESYLEFPFLPLSLYILQSLKSLNRGANPELYC